MATERSAPYVVYTFLGMAETEEEKIFYWDQWESCFYILDEILAPFAKSSWMKAVRQIGRISEMQNAE
jgi:hypothetical protein